MPSSDPSAEPAPRRPAVPKRVLVTGAAGFIGQAVSTAMRAAGADVIGVDRVADPIRGIVAGDTTAPATWQQAAAGCDVIVHTAAVVSNAVDLAEQWRVNVLGTRRVLEVAAAAGVGRVVHLSSVRAFSDTGFPDGVTEDHPVRPDGNPYVDTKIASEHVALQAHAGGELDVVVVRPGDVYGPGCRPWVLTPLALIASHQFVLPALGRGVFSPVYIDDLVDGIIRASTHPAAAGQVFTISAAHGVTCAAYFRHLFRFARRRGPIVVPTRVLVPLSGLADRLNRLTGRRNEVNPTSVRYFTRKGTYSIEKARRVLGYEPQVELEEGMRRTGAWLRAEGLID